MAVFLWRNAGEPAPAGQQNFTDVPTTSFANTAISWLVEAGITTGTTPTTFSPNNKVTRAQMAVFLHRNAGEPAPTGQQNFTDVPTTSFANTAISWLVEAGITTGTTPTTFSPQANVTRAEMAVFLWRYNCPDPNLGNVTTLAGSTAGFADGPAATAQFNFPNGVAVAPNGTVYVADRFNHSIRAINPTTSHVTTLAGNGTAGFADGTGTTARFNNPTGVAVAPNGTIYVADGTNDRIRAINPTTGAVTTLAGTGTEGFADGTGTTAHQRPTGWPSRRTAPSTSPTSATIESGPSTPPPARSPPSPVALPGLLTAPARPPSSTSRPGWRSPPTAPSTSPTATTGSGRSTRPPVWSPPSPDPAPTGLPTAPAPPPNSAPRTAWQSPPAAPSTSPTVSNYRIRAINPTTSRVTTLAGSGTEGFADGTGTNAQFNRPYGVAVAPNGTIYVADTDNHRIRKIT
ncbi:MAG: S-layer homology domain-containing protein [Candidatus Microthrix sp.]|nr:S-layer homology domain-containing protein [Candidatus Microthrix sp.]MBK9559847.1 S-layer homology domain-containing protein [Candidatus Microthrix sp.]